MMNAEKQEENMFEIKIPIFCEWSFENNLSSDPGYESLHDYVYKLADGMEQRMLSTPKYCLPGFPGIEYYLSIYMESNFWLEFNFDTNHDSYSFDVDFIGTVTGCEPKHFVQNCKNREDYDTITSFELCFCSEDCDGCTVCTNNKIIVRVEGTVTVKYVDSLQYFSFEVSDETRKLRWEKIDTKDFVIIAEDREIRVHKSILSENSTVFARMLDSDNWKETMENKIVIPDFSFEIVKYAIDACYGGSFLNPPSKKEEYLMLFQFADKYNMEKYTKTIKKIIDFTPHNAVEYANYFFQNDVIELVDCCIDYIFTCSQYSIPIKDIEMLDTQKKNFLLLMLFMEFVMYKYGFDAKYLKGKIRMLVKLGGEEG